MWLTVFCIVSAFFRPAMLDESATFLGIAVAHSAFNIACTTVLLPMSSLLEKLAYKLVPDTKEKEVLAELDERLLATPPIALERCSSIVGDMAEVSISALKNSLNMLHKYDAETAKCVEPLEQVVDELKAEMRNRHINRLKRGECSIEAGFVWADLITNLERTADHCSNIAVCVIDAKAHNMNMHESMKSLRKNNAEFDRMYDLYAAKYSIL